MFVRGGLTNTELAIPRLYLSRFSGPVQPSVAPLSHRLTRYRRGCRDGASPVAVRAPRLPARERELADHHEERQAKRQARRQEPFHFRRRQGAPAQRPASPLLPPNARPLPQPNAPRRHIPARCCRACGAPCRGSCAWRCSPGTARRAVATSRTARARTSTSCTAQRV